MKTTFKKIAAFTAATLITAALAVPVFADPADTPVTFTTPAESVSFDLSKEIIVFNTDGSDIFAPNVTYTYSVAPVTSTNAKITDTNKTPDNTKDDIVVKVKPGIADTVSLASDGKIIFGSTDDDAATVKTTAESVYTEGLYTDDTIQTINGSVKVTISAENFEDPGVYRYVITDTTESATLAAAGIDRSDKYENKLYLDVYVRYDDQEELGVYGYVLFRGGTDGANTSFDDVTNDVIKPADNDDDSVKVSGFDTDSEILPGGTGSGGSTDPDTYLSDQYHTYNVEVTKEVTGSLGDKKHEFPFQINLANTAGITSETNFSYAINKGTATATALDGNGAWASSTSISNLALKHGDSILITGLPVGETIKVLETNDTTDTYKVSAVLNGGEANTYGATYLDEEVVAGGAAAVGMANVEAIDNKGASNAPINDVIAFTNDLEAISPTGLLFTVAPFAAMAGLGAGMIVLFSKNKKRDDAENII